MQYKSLKQFRWWGTKTAIWSYAQCCPLYQLDKTKYRQKKNKIVLPEHSQVPVDANVHSADYNSQTCLKTQPFFVEIGRCTRAVTLWFEGRAGWRFIHCNLTSKWRIIWETTLYNFPGDCGIPSCVKSINSLRTLYGTQNSTLHFTHRSMARGTDPWSQLWHTTIAHKQVLMSRSRGSPIDHLSSSSQSCQGYGRSRTIRCPNTIETFTHSRRSICNTKCWDQFTKLALLARCYTTTHAACFNIFRVLEGALLQPGADG